jgi:hypothetical protein
MRERLALDGQTDRLLDAHTKRHATQDSCHHGRSLPEPVVSLLNLFGIFVSNFFRPIRMGSKTPSPTHRLFECVPAVGAK